MPRTAKRWTVGLIASTLAAVISCSARAVDVDPRIARTISAWKERESRIKTARFTVGVKQFTSAGAVQFDKDTSSPDRDVRTRSTESMIWDGTRMRTKIEGPIWSDREQRFLANASEESFDGVKHVLLKTVGTDPPQVRAFRLEGRQLELQVTLAQMPLMYFLRPTDPEFGFIDAAKMKSAAEQPDDLLTIELNLDHPRSLSIAVDPARDYSVVRMRLSGDNPRELDIDYALDRQHGWLPKRWVSAIGRKGQLTESNECTVDDYQINRPIRPEEFEIAIPPGVIVEDLRRTK